MVNQQQPENGASEQEILSPKSAGRRRFTKAGAAASGVLLTLHSTSALAGGGGGGGGTVCTTGSGSMSAGVSRVAASLTCSGGGPVYWSSHTWPSSCKKTDLYGGTFSCGGTMGNAQFWDVVTKNNNSYDPTLLCKYLTCAHLNVVSGKTNFTTTANLQKMWNEYRAAGYYSPAANIKWYAADIVAYLKKTMLYT